MLRMIVALLVLHLCSIQQAHPAFSSSILSEVQEKVDLANGTIEFIDDLGSRVILQVPVKRTISLAPNITELVFSAGAGDTLLAVSAHSDYPTDALALPVVANGGSVSHEAILRLRPDIVLVWASGTAPGNINRLKELGLTVIAIEPRTFEALELWVVRIGKLAGTEIIAQHAVEKFRDILAIDAGISTSSVDEYGATGSETILVELSQKPLMALSGKHLLGHIAKACGANILFSDSLQMAPLISIEAVYAQDPELIIQFSRANPPEKTACITDSYWQTHQSLSAVKNGFVCQLDGDLLTRHTLRAAEGAKQLCGLLERYRQRNSQSIKP
ncbi:MAG: ABC transporter substrate-binding protein [Proteobacteria bacterium]|nr:ABC transporter substrate-binding protein [Pseudomonadota bacterium]